MTQVETRSKSKPFFHFWRCFWLTFLVVSLAFAWHSYYVPANKIAWADDYKSAQQNAVESSRPIVLYFTGTWCVPCRIMKREVWADDQVLETVSANFVAVAIDVSDPENAALMDRYKVKGAPVSIVTDPHGNVIDWRAGRVDKAEFLEMLELSNQFDGVAF